MFSVNWRSPLGIDRVSYLSKLGNSQYGTDVVGKQLVPTYILNSRTFSKKNDAVPPTKPEESETETEPLACPLCISSVDVQHGNDDDDDIDIYMFSLQQEPPDTEPLVHWLRSSSADVQHEIDMILKQPLGTEPLAYQLLSSSQKGMLLQVSI